jgi:hypothetical protein
VSDEEEAFTDEELAEFLESARKEVTETPNDRDTEFINTVVDLYLRTRAQALLDGKPMRVSRQEAHEVGLAVMKTYLDARDPDELWEDWDDPKDADDDD